jgi:hypothetical protein
LIQAEGPVVVREPDLLDPLTGGGASFGLEFSTGKNVTEYSLYIIVSNTVLDLSV